MLSTSMTILCAPGGPANYKKTGAPLARDACTVMALAGRTYSAGVVSPVLPSGAA